MKKIAVVLLSLALLFTALLPAAAKDMPILTPAEREHLHFKSFVGVRTVTNQSELVFVPAITAVP